MWTKTNSTLSLCVLFLFCVILIQRCHNGKGDISVADTVKISDTQWLKQDTFWREKPVPYKVEVPAEIPDSLKVSSNCDTAKKQYGELVLMYIAKKLYTDTVRLDSSYVVINDMVAFNEIMNREYILHKQYPIITNTTTITKTLPAKRQIYFGGGISGNKQQLINRFDIGLLYKDRKDRIFILNGVTDIKGNVSAEIESYWKISLKRK